STRPQSPTCRSATITASRKGFSNDSSCFPAGLCSPRVVGCRVLRLRTGARHVRRAEGSLADGRDLLERRKGIERRTLCLSMASVVSGMATGSRPARGENGPYRRHCEENVGRPRSQLLVSVKSCHGGWERWCHPVFRQG